MPNPDLVWADPTDQAKPSGSSLAMIEAIRQCIIADPNVEIYQEDAPAPGSKEWTSCKHVAGSPNTDCIYVFFASDTTVPVARTPDAPAWTSRLWCGMAPFGGGATMGDPTTAAPGALFTGGAAKNRAFYGMGGAMWLNTNGVIARNTTVRLLTTAETLMLVTIGSADLTCVSFYGGAAISPYADGSGGTDDRIYMQWCPNTGCDDTAGIEGTINADALTVWDGNDGFLQSDSNSAWANQEWFALDPTTETTWRRLQRWHRTFGVDTDTHLDLDDAASFQRMGVRYRNANPKQEKIGFLRNIYPWRKQLSNTLVTADSGGSIVGRTLGRQEGVVSECFLLGRTV
jgi:hypothetical protein